MKFSTLSKAVPIVQHTHTKTIKTSHIDFFMEQLQFQSKGQSSAIGCVSFQEKKPSPVSGSSINHTLQKNMHALSRSPLDQGAMVTNILTVNTPRMERSYTQSNSELELGAQSSS